MEILKEGETFYEYPDAVLLVDNSFKYYYVKAQDGNKYIAWKEFYSIQNIDKEAKITTQKNVYKNILDGEIILEEMIVKDSFFRNGIVKPLNWVLNIKGNQKYEFEKDDILTLTSFENKKTSKTKKKSL